MVVFIKMWVTRVILSIHLPPMCDPEININTMTKRAKTTENLPVLLIVYGFIFWCQQENRIIFQRWDAKDSIGWYRWRYWTIGVWSIGWL